MISGNEAGLVAPVVDAFDLAVLFGAPLAGDLAEMSKGADEHADRPLEAERALPALDLDIDISAFELSDRRLPHEIHCFTHDTRLAPLHRADASGLQPRPLIKALTQVTTNSASIPPVRASTERALASPRRCARSPFIVARAP
jgi:hypothetical protein